MNNNLRNFLYLSIKLFNPLINNTLYTQLLFLLQNLRLGKRYYYLDLKTPKTFNEKISWIKFHERNPLSTMVADKLEVRNYVKQIIGEDFLIPILEIFKTPEDINLSRLPNKFVLKLTNGSGMNYLCQNKFEADEKQIKLKFSEAYKINPYYLSREWHYNSIQPKIVAEELLEYNIKDFKFFCSKNGPFMIQVDKNRFTYHTRNIYDLKWNLQKIKIRYPNDEEPINCPKNLELMIEIAKKLSKQFIFSRIDLYEHNGKVYFGEITLHPGGGVEPFDSYESDKIMGSNILL